MADDGQDPKDIGDGKDRDTFPNVVSKITVKALQEFDTGDYDPSSSAPEPEPGTEPKAASRAGSAKPSPSGSQKGTPKGSAKPSPSGSQKGTPRGSARGTPQASPKITPQGTPKGTPKASPKATPRGSKQGTPVQSPSQTPRPSSSAGKPPSRPASGRGSRASSGKPATGEEPSSRPTSAVIKDGRPQLSRPSSGIRPEPSRDRPESIGSRPSSRPSSKKDLESGSRVLSSRRTEALLLPEEDKSHWQAVDQEPEPQQEAEPSGPVEGQWGVGPDESENQEFTSRSQPKKTEPKGRFRQQPEERRSSDHISEFTMGAGGGGDDDDDGSFGGSEEEEEEFDGEGEEYEEDEESEGENEMVVLDPDHPLMKRFQKALNDHLVKQDEKVSLELKELDEALRNKKKEREEVGVELYGVQQELARHQMMLEKNHDQLAQLKNDRNQTEVQLADIRDMYRNKQFSCNSEKNKGAELQGEVENLALRLFYMENAKEDVRSDIAVMRRAAEKADTEVAKSEVDKQKQDLYVDRLVERVDKLREEIGIYEAQIQAQTDELKMAREALMEAHMEIEAISMEKKQLFQQWNSSLIGMKRRDEAHAAMMEALSQQQQRILSLETEIEGFKKAISKEQEQNEKLTMVLAKTESDIATVKKMLTNCRAKHDALKNEYATYTRMLHETEQSLNRANTEKTLRENEDNALRKQIEREYMEKVKLEDEILEKLRSQLTMDKAAQYTKKITGNLRGRTKDLETQVAIAENNISKEMLEISNTKTRTERIKKSFDELDEEIKNKNDIVSKSEQDIVRRNAVVERKQQGIDQYNKKLEQLIQSAGGVELGPLEITINSLKKSIESENDEINELQQMWLRNQNELVSLSENKDHMIGDVDHLKKQITILSQKKLRIEGDINQEKADTTQIERNITHMQNDMIKLNQLLHKERGLEYSLEKDNTLKENDFMNNLREAERESIDMQANLNGLKEEKERLLNSLVEAERQIMLWEKKTQLARETRAAVDSEIGQGEIKAMKAEIHRMQVRYAQLMKQQEKMIQEMEKAVSRRDTIVTRGEAQSKIQKTGKPMVTKGNFQRQMGELRKKIKQTIQDAQEADGEIRRLKEHQSDISSQLEDRQLNVQQLQGNSDTLDGDLEKLIETKQKNLTDLLARQQKAKYYQQVKDGRYTRICKTNASLDNELAKQVERVQMLGAIVDRLNQEYPHAQPSLRRVSVALAVKTGDL